MAPQAPDDEPTPISAASEEKTVQVKSSPLPKGQLTILCIVLLTESICSTVLVPYVALYVAFMQGWKEKEAGYLAGFPVGLFMLGQVLSSKAWSSVSDNVGRKFGIGCGIFLCAICMFFFGLSSNIYVACLWRFCHGLSAGCSIAAKTMITDVTDNTNRAKGMALVSLTWGVGTLIGPSIGGFFYDPVSSSKLKWMNLSPDGFFAHFPAFLPSCIAAVYNFVAVVICVFFLRETNKTARTLRKLLPSVLVRYFGPCIDFIQPKLPYDKADVVVIESGETTEAAASTHPSSEHPNGAAVSIQRTTEPRKNSFGFKQAFQNSLTRSVCIVSMLISASDMIYAEALPLWAILPVEDGGLNLDASLMSYLILVNSVPAVLSNIFFPKAIACFGDLIWFWQIAQGVYALHSFLVPFASYLGPTRGFYYTLVVGMSRKVWESWSFALLMVIVAQTAPRGRVCAMYGVQQATACISRCGVPFIFPLLFAWSVAVKHPFPFNHCLVFILAAVPLIVSALITRRIIIPGEDERNDSDNGSDGEDFFIGDDQASSRNHRENRSSSNARNTAWQSTRSHHSYLGSTRPRPGETSLLLSNSYGTLMNSFATNIVPGMAQPTILPVPIGSAMRMNESEIGGTPVADSRDNSSQDGDDVDGESQYSEDRIVSPAVAHGSSNVIVESEDLRMEQRYVTLDEEMELPL